MTAGHVVAVFSPHVSHIYSNFRRYLESPLILNSYTFFNSFISRGRSTLLPAVKLKPKAIFGRMFSEDQELYRVSVVVKHDDGKYLVHFINFGNTEVKLQSELFNIPALVYIQHIFLCHNLMIHISRHSVIHIKH